HPTSLKPLSALFAGVVLSLAASGAMAQAAPAATTSTTVGVTPQDAAEANRKAVPRADTGTLVRTGDTAADKARAMNDKPGAATTAAPMATQSAENPGTMNAGTAPTKPRNTPRAARADRN
ncbi:MAG: hypothetical protein K2Q97_14015, partial [Burkholderiaceae bacterium]|nr:hypothetical protein [Burkholderiaceae bacterium]